MGLCLLNHSCAGSLSCVILVLPLQDMDNIASVFTHKTWQTGGLKAATKSMFKSRVNLKRPAAGAAGASRLAKLPSLPEDAAAAAAAATGDASNAYVSRGSLMASSSKKALLLSEQYMDSNAV